MKEHKVRDARERRKYIRLKSVFPVEFVALEDGGGKAGREIMQGFTADISTGGILLRVNAVSPEMSRMLQKKNLKLALNIHIPLGSKPVKAVANIAWMTVVKEFEHEACLIGLSFEEIDPVDKRRLVGYTASLHRAPMLTAVALAIMIIALGFSRMEEGRLTKENKTLVGRLSDVLLEKGAIRDILDETGSEKAVLIGKLEKQRQELEMIDRQRQELIKEEEGLKNSTEDADFLKDELAKRQAMIGILEAQAKKLAKQKSKLLADLDTISGREAARLDELKTVEEARLKLEASTLENMYNWLRLHRNKRTGLVVSYEGDRSLRDFAFTYDQALASQVFMLYDDMEKAEAILDFFNKRAKRVKGALINAYNARGGTPAEYTTHVGPNIWIGITCLQHARKTGSDKYLDLAREIAEWVVDLKKNDPEGGISGGPDIRWYSTEHNLDAYAFFMMFAEIADEARYELFAGEVLEWLKENAFTGKAGIHRGKGDSTIATDTFSWAIAALGPKTLISAGMDPDAIMAFAEDNCRVKVDFKRPDGKIVEITGFDFAKHRNMARGGVVSSEWTAQMIVSFGIMGDFYSRIGEKEKADIYFGKRDFYINEIEKMIISSPSRVGQGAGCLPYASQGNADTGHGWRTPTGESTGSVSGTAYGIFAVKGYNPLELKREE